MGMWVPKKADVQRILALLGEWLSGVPQKVSAGNVDVFRVGRETHKCATGMLYHADCPQVFLNSSEDGAGTWMQFCEIYLFATPKNL